MAIRDGKGDSPDVVGYYAHGYIRGGILSISDSRHRSQSMDKGLEDIRIVIGSLALQGHTQTLESHARIDHLVWQRRQGRIGFPIVLHEDEVPYLNDLRMALIDQLQTVYLGTLFVRTQVDMYFRAGTAGSGRGSISQ